MSDIVTFFMRTKFLFLTAFPFEESGEGLVPSCPSVRDSRDSALISNQILHKILMGPLSDSRDSWTSVRDLNQLPTPRNQASRWTAFFKTTKSNVCRYSFRFLNC